MERGNAVSGFNSQRSSLLPFRLISPEPKGYAIVKENVEWRCGSDGGKLEFGNVPGLCGGET
ncbi:MAG: hypothetical protein A2170_07295 [Deltaproteobacteria bacterium RBG_13_53_10]|nr:MAG: hypothetical protein A2170_07295 [Deltaproteobacteria bacterium RBG_13_53_10]